MVPTINTYSISIAVAMLNNFNFATLREIGEISFNFSEMICTDEVLAHFRNLIRAHNNCYATVRQGLVAGTVTITLINATPIPRRF
jgi:hypothetical protein